MVILSYRSPYLRRILSTNKKENDESLVHIKLPNISPNIFEIILGYIYGGKISLEKFDTTDVVRILVAAGELSLRELITYIQSYLIKKKSTWVEKNFNLVYQTSFKNETFLELQRYCTDSISKDPDKIFHTPNFFSIPEKLLINLIQNDNLTMNEIEVWDHVLKWGLAQNPELPSDPTKFSKEDFNILRDTLEKFIPFIKFYNLSSKEFLVKVLPYKKVLPKELHKNLIKYYLDPNNSNNNNNKSEGTKSYIPKEINSKNIKSIDSKIITSQHAELISSWIDRYDITDKLITNNTYDFKLLIRGSRDGFSPKKFHEICDCLPHTVSIIKVKYHNEILGGYNQITWDSDSMLDIAKDNFIFSFKDKDNIDNHILSRVKNEKQAINNWFIHGPSFGDGDLTLSGLNYYDDNYCKKSSYEVPIRESGDRFSIEEYEVFQIIKENKLL
ncbi:carbohydrate-binding module family 13 protein [Rhizophagus irregularis DAOM 181602=DAOM 197198]|nr:carbohydrate-binding module family 13 protein [Rhizophagus irregularis DAOM 181602=DAOM 197198]